jgi:hypothetical protein
MRKEFQGGKYCVLFLDVELELDAAGDGGSYAELG